MARRSCGHGVSVLVGLAVACAIACAAEPKDDGAGATAGTTASGGVAGQLAAAGSSAGAAGDVSVGTAASGGAASTAGAGGAGAGAAGSSSSRADAGGVPTDAGSFEVFAACPGTIAELFSEATIAPPKGGSGIFNAVTADRMQALEASIRALVAGDVTTAEAEAGKAAYEICRADDAGSPVMVVRPLVSGEGHAVIAWRVAPAVPLIVEAPHAWHDADTDIEATEMFLELDARALVLSGIYRCSSLEASPCDGYTTACTGLPIRYTKSDAAHNVEMLFQAAHVALADSFATDFVTSLHGFGDAGISVSNSTPSAMPAADSLHVRLVEALATELPGEKITSCQDYGGAPFEKRMCGSENVQARHVNGSANICGANASTTSNRFVHIEQSRAVRDARAKVIAAFAAALK